MSFQQSQIFNLPKGMFSLGKDNALPSQYIYDETYKNYKMKQKFQKDPKYSYFNAVMQMRRKLSAKQQIYKKVFERKDNQEQIDDQLLKLHQGRKTFYIKNSQADIPFGDIPERDVVRIQKLKKNSFKIMKQQPSIDALMSRSKNLQELLSMNRTTGGKAQFRTGHRSNMSLYQKQSNKSRNELKFQMKTKQRNNKSYVQLQITQLPKQFAHNRSIPTPLNPKPRLDEIMSQYRRMNNHSHNDKSRNKKSFLSKQLIEKMYTTNKLFYSHQGKKRSALY